MLSQLFGSLLVKAYTLEQGMKNKRSTTAKALQSPLYRQRVKQKKRPYYDAKEVMDNDFSHDGLTPIGYYIEEVEDDKG
jgi:stalled ribosome alternative rescue factor ArfA